MVPYSQTRASPAPSGLMITEEMVIARIMEKLDVCGFDSAVRLFEQYEILFYGFPGWELTREKLKQILKEAKNPPPPPRRPKRAKLKPGELPPELSTPEAMVLWRKAQDAGLVDNDFQPLVTRTQAALLADEMIYRLGIDDKKKWKLFETAWNREQMSSDFARAQFQQQYNPFLNKLKTVFD